MPESGELWSEYRETAKQIRRFLVIGGLSVLTDLAIYALLTQLGFVTHASKGVSYVSGMIVGFIGNKCWTFESARRSIDEPIIYVILYAITLGVNVLVNGLVLAIAAHWLPPITARGTAFFVATATTTVMNFAGMRLITFRVGIRQRRRCMESMAAEIERAVRRQK